MPSTNELIEKYRAQMREMIEKSNFKIQNMPTQTQETQTQSELTPDEEINVNLQENTRLEDFPQFVNNGDELTKRIEQILMQNNDVSRESDMPLGVLNENQNADINAQDQGMAEEISRTCIRGGQKAQYSPPANTGSAVNQGGTTAPPLTDSADIVINVFAANQGYPINNATIRLRDPENRSVLALLTTDENGLTRKVTLAAPDRTLSQNSQFPNPFVNYFADIRAEGYVPQSNLKIQVFGGQNSVLPANLIPQDEFNFT